MKNFPRVHVIWLISLLDYSTVKRTIQINQSFFTLAAKDRIIDSSQTLALAPPAALSIISNDRERSLAKKVNFSKEG